MALVDIFDAFGRLFGKKPRTVIFAQVENGPPQPLFTIDSTPLMEHNMSATATEFPIEDGSFVSDHVQRKPRELLVEGFITNDPSNPSSFLVRSAFGITGQIMGDSANNLVIGGASVLTDKLMKKIREDSSGGLPSELAFKQLENVLQASTPCQIQTGLKVYVNMNLENVLITETARTANALVFRASFKEIRVATSEVVDIRAEDTADGNSKIQNRGVKAAETVSETVSRPATGAFRLLEAAGGVR